MCRWFFAASEPLFGASVTARDEPGMQGGAVLILLVLTFVAFVMWVVRRRPDSTPVEPLAQRPQSQSTRFQETPRLELVVRQHYRWQPRHKNYPIGEEFRRHMEEQ